MTLSTHIKKNTEPKPTKEDVPFSSSTFQSFGRKATSDKPKTMKCNESFLPNQIKFSIHYELTTESTIREEERILFLLYLWPMLCELSPVDPKCIESKPSESHVRSNTTMKRPGNCSSTAMKPTLLKPFPLNKPQGKTLDQLNNQVHFRIEFLQIPPPCMQTHIISRFR